MPLCAEVEWEAGDSRSRSAPTQVCPWDVEPGHDAAGTGTTARGHAQAMNRGLSALLAAKRAAAEGPDTPGPYPGHAPTRVVPRPVAPAAVAQIGALFGAQGPGTAAPSLPAAFANAIAEHPCARVSDAVLATIGSRDRFLDLLSSYHRWHGLRLKVPTFAYAELDLWTVFVEVARRGGYAAVTNSKASDVACQCLHAWWAYLELISKLMVLGQRRRCGRRCATSSASICAARRAPATRCATTTSGACCPSRTTSSAMTSRA